MAGSEDTELRDLVLEALEKNGSLAKIRALLRANVFLAFESEREPPRHNPALDLLLASPEGSLALGLVAEFLDVCDLANTAYVYKAESRQGRAYRYDGRRSLLERLGGEYATKHEPMLVTLLKQALGHRRKKPPTEKGQINHNESPKNDAPRKEDDNCTYIVHDESGSTSTRSHSDNSTDDKNKLHLRLPLDNSDTDTSSDSARDKTHSEYIPNENIRLDADSEDDSKNSNYILNYFDQPAIISNPEIKNNSYVSYANSQNAAYSMEGQTNVINSSNSTSYLEIKSRPIFPNISNGNVDGIDHRPGLNLLQETMDNNENVSQRSVIKMFDQDMQAVADSQSHSVMSNISKNGSLSHPNNAKLSPDKSLDRQANSTKMDVLDKSEVNYSDDFSPTQESNMTSNKGSNKNTSPKSADSSSIQEDISLNSSEKTTSESPDHRNLGSSHSSVSLSDVAELLDNSVRGSPPPNGKSPTNLPHKSVLVMKSNLDEVAQRLNSLFNNRTDDRRVTTKNSSEEIPGSPLQSLSNIMEVHSD